MDRASILLRDLSKEARLVEVGPSFSPLAPKRDGWNAFTIDHASREALMEKYAGHPGVDPSRIEEVDFVWQGGSLADAIPADRHGSFDAFIASHVIEHTTDVVTFLKAAETLLRPDGVIVLAIPDKRKCFDFYRNPSTTADALAAFLERRERHDARTQFDYASRMALKGGGPGWNGLDIREACLSNPLEQAPQWLSAAASPSYVDAHNWVFVPASFQLMVVELVAMGYLDLRIEALAEAHDTEFYVWLRRGEEPGAAGDLQERRKRLLDRIIVELAEQSRQIAGSPLRTLAGP